VVLRPPITADVEMRLRYGRHAEIARMYGAADPESTEISREAAERWYSTVARDPLAWIVETDGVCAGVVRLHSLVERDKRARLAIGLLHPDLLGRGTGTTAIRVLLRHAFDALELHRVDLRVLSFNVRAVRCYEKCGFVREGIDRESAFVDGAWVDDVMMSILEHEYRALAPIWFATEG
jgi:RimJ/RimL family protein N-acetyltransferase